MVGHPFSFFSFAPVKKKETGLGKKSELTYLAPCKIQEEFGRRNLATLEPRYDGGSRAH
jgi:hypothetical protein